MIGGVAGPLARGAVRAAGVLLLALFLAELAPGAALAQGGAGDGQNGNTDRLIVADVPERGSRLHRLQARVIGHAKKRVLGLTRSEVWHVPKGQSQRIAERLVGLGIKVTRLREGWNHVLNAMCTRSR